MLVKLIPVVNFINILLADFTRTDPKCIKIQLSHQYFFAHWGSALVKAVRKMLMKLTPGFESRSRSVQSIVRQDVSKDPGASGRRVLKTVQASDQEKESFIRKVIS